MELHRFFRYAIEKMCKEKKSLNHFSYFYQMIKLVYYVSKHTMGKNNVNNKYLAAFSLYLVTLISKYQIYTYEHSNLTGNKW